MNEGLVESSPLRCQETLDELVSVNGAFVSPAIERRYPFEGGLVFMGYPVEDEEFMKIVIAHEREWQGTATTAERDLDFLRWSSPEAVLVINSATEVLGEPSPQRALDLGCGSGWCAWLMAEAGYDTWMCDFEANSLSLGLLYEHPNLGIGHRIVVDGRYAPFADASFDLVLCKEFAHHIADKRALLAEVNRILRPGGVLAFTEPAMGLRGAVDRRRHGEDHPAHSYSWPRQYLRALRSQGFSIERLGYYYGASGRSRLTTRLKRRADRGVIERRRRPGLLTEAFVHAAGASQVAIARKQDEAERISRPPMRLIPPSEVRVGDSDRAAFAPLADVLRVVSRDLDRLA
jgi:SAM-dependent methyltransferase